jgi:predicted RNA-binding protein with PUA-like domain
VAKWLLKTEPECYAWNDLVRDKRATWDGVTNALALKHMRTMKKGDAAFIYHTGGERSIIGIAEIVGNPYPDPKEMNEKIVVVDLKLSRQLNRPVTLEEIKADPAFAGWELIRNSRLGVMPVPEKMWDRIEKLAKENTK